MTQPKNLDPYTSPRAFYGAELRRLRERSALSQEQLGERVFCSGTYVGQFESAVRRPQTDVSRLFDDVLGSGEHLQRLCRLARRSKHPDYFADAAELEKLATTISEYAPMLVPGLLQTEDYTRAVIRAIRPDVPDTEVERRVTARMTRQKLLTEPNPPEYWAVIDEAVLCRAVGGPQVMRAQLGRLVELAALPHVTLQVVPFTAGSHAGMEGPFLILGFPELADPDVVYVENTTSGVYLEQPSDVHRYTLMFDHLRAAALKPDDTAALIERAADRLA